MPSRRSEDETLQEFLESQARVLRRLHTTTVRPKAGKRIEFWRSSHHFVRLRPLLRLMIADYRRRLPRGWVIKPGSIRYSRPVLHRSPQERGCWEGYVSFTCCRARA